MVIISADVKQELADYVESLRGDVLPTRSDVIRQIIIEHRNRIKSKFNPEG